LVTPHGLQREHILFFENVFTREVCLDRLKSSPLHTHQIIHDDGTVEIPAVAKEVLFPFILSQEGNVRLLEPAELKTELKRKLQKMLAQC